MGSNSSLRISEQRAVSFPNQREELVQLNARIYSDGFSKEGLERGLLHIQDGCQHYSQMAVSWRESSRSGDCEALKFLPPFWRAGCE